MAALIRRLARGQGLFPVLVLLGLLLVMLVVVAGATTNSTHFEQVYAWLLLASAVGLAVLAALILYNLISLLGLYRRQVPGARLILRLVGIFAVLAITPVALVYGFSLNFLQRGIDSWFNVQVDRGLEDALELSRTALDLRMRDVLKQTTRIAD
ncbi:MAG TPA: two-component sensor histidine kinase, partial [Candidatus Competibacter sp.]|nr:two-component sensor histidine kinase [Candidatus Competibacter sp.]